MKGARREIKKDNQFLARQKLHEQMERYCVLLHTFVWRSHSRVAMVREYHLENDFIPGQGKSGKLCVWSGKLGRYLKSQVIWEAYSFLLE